MTPRLQSLPAEILDRIIFHLGPSPAPALSEYYDRCRANPVAPIRKQEYHDRQRALCSLGLTSKQFLHYARMHLYKNVSIYYHKQLYCLFRTMVLVPPLARKIENLDTYIAFGEQNTTYSSFFDANDISHANPLTVTHYYQQQHGHTMLEVIHQRMAPTPLSADMVIDQMGMLSLPRPSCVIFPAVLALATNLEGLQVELHRAGLSSTVLTELDDGVSALCDSTQGVYFAKLRSLRLHRFNSHASSYSSEVPVFISRLARLVESVHLVGLHHPDLRHNPISTADRFTTVSVLLTELRTSNITRLELTFDIYCLWPVKKQLNMYLLGLSHTLQHLSVVFLGYTNSHRHLEMANLLLSDGDIMGTDRIESLPLMTSLTHFEVDLHSLFGWARIWTLDKQHLVLQYPEILGCQLLRDTIPKSLKSLHLVETWTDLQLTLNHLAPTRVAGERFSMSNPYVNTLLYQMGWHLDVRKIEPEYDLLTLARKQVIHNVLDDLVLMVHEGALPHLEKFVFTPITHAAGLHDYGFDCYLVHTARALAEMGVKMDIVYGCRLGRLCL